MLVIHYHRFDGDYEKVSLWTWDTEGRFTPPISEFSTTEFDEFGAVFRIDETAFSAPGVPPRIGFIPRLRLDWNTKDGHDRVWTPEDGAEIWLVGMDPGIYSDRPDVAPRIQAAFLDSPRVIAARLTHGIELGRLVPDTFQVKSAAGPTFTIAGIRASDALGGRARSFELVMAEDIPPAQPLMLLAEGYRPSPITIRRLLMDRTRFFTDKEMGYHHTSEVTSFRLFAPTARAVDLILYDHPTGPVGRRVYPMQNVGKGIWEGELPGDLLGKHYMYLVRADGVMANREVVDIHSRCNTGRDGRGRIVDLRALDPEGFRPVQRPATIAHPCDAVITEWHVRDFTIHASSGVEEGARGRYIGFAQRGTTIPGTDVKTGIDHLVELGVTHVQLLPVQDFDNDEFGSGYNWGYMTMNFSSPEGWFATDPRSDSRVREFKALVKALHDAGLRVIMDVVYNHTAPNAGFDAVAPGYYYRQRADGSYYNGSGTGNEFFSEAPMARKFIVDSCRFWVEEYGVDGFRFDLMGLIDLETLVDVREAIQAIDPTLLIYGEPWAATGQDGTGIGRIVYKDVVAGYRIGAFNDHFRNDLKGSPDGGEPGFVQTGEKREDVKRGIAGSIHDWARDPGDAIQYATCHDNLTLWDKLVLSVPHETEQQRVRIQMLTAGILAVSQGVLFYHGGHELARTKHGEHNSYDAPDSINQIDWLRKIYFREIFDFMRGMIAIRREHPVFRLRTREEVDARLHFQESWCPNNQCIVFTIKGAGLEGESWSEVLVIINGSAEMVEFCDPSSVWDLYVHGVKASAAPLQRAEGCLNLEPRTMAVLAR